MSESTITPLENGPYGVHGPVRLVDAQGCGFQATGVEHGVSVLGLRRPPKPSLSRRLVNALSDEGASGVRRAYSDAKRARLTAVKDAYDPDNVFHLNHNIAPSGC